MGGAWAADLLQQMLSCAVAAGLMRSLSGGGGDQAAAAAAHATSASSSSSSGAALDSSAQAMCSSISITASTLFCPTAPLWGNKAATATEQYAVFAAHPAVAEVALQLLATRCVVIHKMQVQHQGQQQQQQLLQQLGKRMRGDLLLLSDPQPRLAVLLPGAAMQTAELEQEAGMLAHCKAVTF
jgi:flagellar motor protein MotB